MIRRPCPALLGFLVLAATVLAMPFSVLAQDVEAKFWLKGASGNLQGCIAADPTFTREQTFKLANGQADLDEMLGSAVMSEIFLRNGVGSMPCSRLRM